LSKNEDPVRVQFDLLLKCPDEISDEPVKVVSKRKRGRKSKNSENDIFCAQVLVKKNICFRSKDEYDVADVMHFLHVGFRCDGQPFPAVEGRASFPLDSCRCSRTTRVGQLLSVVPQPACDERIECVLDAARVLAIWWDSGSVSLKVQRIMDKSYKVLTPKAIGFAYAFFRHRCLHVSIMAGTVPQEAPLRHSQLPGWPCDATRVIEYGWRIAKNLEWETIAQSVQYGQEHGRIVVVVPEVLHRIKFCHTSPNMAIFYYKSFREIRATNTAILWIADRRIGDRGSAQRSIRLDERDRLNAFGAKLRGETVPIENSGNRDVEMRRSATCLRSWEQPQESVEARRRSCMSSKRHGKEVKREAIPALPDVKVYSGSDRDYTWDSFTEAFLLKYPRHKLSSKELKNVAQIQVKW
ncbi:hypothetical protein COOONC_03390, partial [Cooperia oncophora]